MDERNRCEDTGTARKSGGDAWKTAYDVPLDMPRLLRAYERHKDGRCPWAGRTEAKTLALAMDTIRSMLRATARRHDVDEGHIRFGLMDGSSDAPACVIDVEETSAEYGVHGYLVSLVDALGGHLFVTPEGTTYLGPSDDTGLSTPMIGWLGFVYLIFRKSD